MWWLNNKKYLSSTSKRTHPYCYFNFRNCRRSSTRSRSYSQRGSRSSRRNLNYSRRGPAVGKRDGRTRLDTRRNTVNIAKILAQYGRVTYLPSLLMECFCNITLGYNELNRCPKVVTILFGNILSTIIAVILLQCYVYNFTKLKMGNIVRIFL